ncbi:MAG: hypothetical protein L0Y74_03610 [candidate division Zixibacteria bacterium]|nr:hypothetical protein [candidate division Zixibacteria bacterium]
MKRDLLVLMGVILFFNLSWSAGEAIAPFMIGDTDDSVHLSIVTSSTDWHSEANVDSVWFKIFKKVSGSSSVLFDSVKVTSPLRTGFYQVTRKASDNNPAIYFAKITAYENDSLVNTKTLNWTINASGVYPVDKTGYSLTAAERDNISGNVWSYSDPITLADTVPQVFAVNAGASNPDTVASHVWSWTTRTLTSGAGSGSNQLTLTVKRSSDGTPLNAVEVQVLNQAQSATEGLLTSNSTGNAVFALNNGIYKIRLFRPGYVFTVPESVIVTQSESATFYGSEFDPGTPPTPELCRVYGYVRDINNLPAVGAKVEASIRTVPLRYQNVIVSPYYKTTVTDNNGYWFMDLFPNQILNPDDTKYKFNIQAPNGSVLRIEAIVPDQASWELSY